MNIADLQRRVQQLEHENALLRAALPPREAPVPSKTPSSSQGGLSLEEYRRYGRQMLVPGFGSLPAQLRLKNARVLVVGAGGLGCPALLYLCGAGIGTLGILDNDTVDISNLHRQVLHTSVGMLKCDSAKRHLAAMNPHVALVTHAVRLDNDNAFGIVANYDVVVDCTDTPATRYLINDVCVLLQKPLVSGSGVRTDGQLTVLNFQGGPCYRCFYPQPPRPDSVSTCSDAGVLGPAIGLTGVALATETIKVLSGYYEDGFSPFLSMYTAYPQQQMRVFKMRGRQVTCAACGDQPSITRAAVESHEVDYAAFCGSVSYPDLPPGVSISPGDAKAAIRDDVTAVVVDVRPKEQFLITSLPGSVNIEWEHVLSKADDISLYLPQAFDSTKDTLFVICRYGNDSRCAARKLLDMGFNVRDVLGGITRWSAEVDPSIPVY